MSDKQLEKVGGGQPPPPASPLATPLIYRYTKLTNQNRMLQNKAKEVTKYDRFFSLDFSTKLCSGHKKSLPVSGHVITVEKVYKAMVQPGLTYCSIAFISLSETNETRLGKIEKTIQKTIFGPQQQINYHGWRSFPSMRSIQSAIFVFACLNGTGPIVFNSYFRKLDHTKATRRNSTDSWIPKVRTENGKRIFGS